MRLHILSALLGVTATLLAVALFWPGAAPSTHAQSNPVLDLDRDWNNVAYAGDSLPVVDALNDALDVTITVWVWRSFNLTWDSWTQVGPAIANSLGRLDRGDIVWMRTSRAGPWTQIGAAQAPGSAGLNCWDLNGNGVFDPVTEDTVIDGVADALDCRGPAGLEGAEGAEGPEGPLGPQGEPGQGDSLEGYEIVSVTAPPSGGLLTAVTATCPLGKKAVGDGVGLGGSPLNLNILESGPTPDGSGWTVQAGAGGLVLVGATAVCVGELFIPIIILP